MTFPNHPNHCGSLQGSASPPRSPWAPRPWPPPLPPTRPAAPTRTSRLARTRWFPMAQMRHRSTARPIPDGHGPDPAQVYGPSADNPAGPSRSSPAAPTRQPPMEPIRSFRWSATPLFPTERNRSNRYGTFIRRSGVTRPPIYK